MTQPYEVRLVVTPTGGPDYTARLDEVAGQQSDPFTLIPPLTGRDAAHLRWYLESYVLFPGAGDAAQAATVEQHLVAWGDRLFKTIFGTVETNDIYRNMQQARDNGCPCTLTIASDDPALLAQPWELMRDKQGPLAFRGVTIRRQLTKSTYYQSPAMSLPLRVLVIVSRPTDTGFIDPRTSIAPLFAVWEALPQGSVQIDFCEPPTFATLEEMLSRANDAQQPYHILHFDGHGNYNPASGEGVLAFEQEDSTTAPVTSKRLGDLLSSTKVPLVMLEACRTAALSEQEVTGSVAPALLQSGVRSVVAFSHSVHVEASRLLVERFYREVMGGKSVGQALQEGRKRLPHAAPSVGRWRVSGETRSMGASPLSLVLGNCSPSQRTKGVCCASPPMGGRTDVCLVGASSAIE